MRKTVIGGETELGDYTVIWDGLAVGRICKTVAVGGHDAWSWSCALPNVPQPSAHRGRAGSLDAAKADFRAAWTDLQSQLPLRPDPRGACRLTPIVRALA
ncbi:hypothetical protein [Bradyrhizobium japonicum]|uniref:hypothetical protein n=1 Tax=Bradyrhizobium japonicum TaxID=375 RepID=UPI000AA228DF|nr:hypothetical protein [Bradyrhizobium japonicum]